VGQKKFDLLGSFEGKVQRQGRRSRERVSMGAAITSLIGGGTLRTRHEGMGLTICKKRWTEQILAP